MCTFYISIVKSIKCVRKLKIQQTTGCAREAEFYNETCKIYS